MVVAVVAPTDFSVGDSACSATESSAAAYRQSPPTDRMHYTSDQLHDVLRLAHGCLRSARLPGELREKDFFEKFDAEAAKKQAADDAEEDRAIKLISKEWNLHSEEVAQDRVESPVRPPTPEGVSTEAKAAKLRRDAQRLERLTAERRQEFEVVSASVAKEVLQRCRAQDELRAAQTEVQKIKKAVREAREMQRIQAKEIEELWAAQLRASELQKTASAPRSRGPVTVRPPAEGGVGSGEATVPRAAATSGEEGPQETVPAGADSRAATSDNTDGLTIAVPPPKTVSAGAPPVAAAYVEKPKTKVYSSVRNEKKRNVKVYF
mmetsp:Transcript_60158/g.173545  ORF Transcript_60158/g.173545 Transcript_60158/m.173545 type:complete len:321 (-) Transcript_60158:64-1026(-)